MATTDDAVAAALMPGGPVMRCVMATMAAECGPHTPNGWIGDAHVDRIDTAGRSALSAVATRTHTLLSSLQRRAPPRLRERAMQRTKR